MLLGFADPTEKTEEIAASLPKGVIDLISIGADKVAGNEHDEIRNIAALLTIGITWRSGNIIKYNGVLKTMGDYATYTQLGLWAWDQIDEYNYSGFDSFGIFNISESRERNWYEW